MGSCSSNSTHWIYDVFLSFRGEDTRKSLVADLYVALSNKGILTFMDDELPRGMGIKPELERAIEGSRISIVIFSKNYSSSSWCLNELLKIMDCCATYNQVIVPVFYDVDPSDVRHQKGRFGEHLDALDATPDMLSKWKTVLTKAANISGWDASIFSQDYDLVDHIGYWVWGDWVKQPWPKSSTIGFMADSSIDVSLKILEKLV
ncbi:hypothetical protein VNO78_04510 [Psophocarpus tetragonolobus]|uniref:ADP-ribosyl cyclase/cyclic ADP-ribose hydrolase n=1 Tax=Psophocarpus tetragonolobus TaxID=3891 RepID=A0AAN9TEZ1_PSOTE